MKASVSIGDSKLEVTEQNEVIMFEYDKEVERVQLDNEMECGRVIASFLTDEPGEGKFREYFPNYC